MHVLSIAAGMLMDVEPALAAEAAAAAGFDALGLRFGPPGPDDRAVETIRRRAQDAGLRILDVEFVRFLPDEGEPDWPRRLVEIGTGLDADFLIVVSYDPDRSRTSERYAQLCEQAGDLGRLRPAFEFMRPTAVKTIDAALEVVSGAQRGAVLVDALHLHRGGTPPERVADVDPDLVPYLQLCDAPGPAPAEADADLMHEARYGRLLPGEGDLPLHALLDAAPADAPISLEVLSQDLMKNFPPVERARVAMETTRTFFSARQPKSTG